MLVYSKDKFNALKIAGKNINMLYALNNGNSDLLTKKQIEKLRMFITLKQHILKYEDDFTKQAINLLNRLK